MLLSRGGVVCVKRVMIAFICLVCCFFLIGAGPALYSVNCLVPADGYDGKVSLYHVGNAEGNFDDVYFSSGLDLTMDNEDDFRQLCSSLESYVLSSSIDVYKTVAADNGRVEFSDVESGMYLILAEKYATDEGTWFVAPFVKIIKEPVSMELKLSFVPADETVNLVVEKKWRNCSSGPGVEVDILKDGQVYEQVTLNDDNEWIYELSGLESGFKWSAKEHDVPDGYSCSVEVDGEWVTITNTLKEKPPVVSTSSPSLTVKPSLTNPVTGVSNPVVLSAYQIFSVAVIGAIIVGIFAIALFANKK